MDYAMYLLTFTVAFGLGWGIRGVQKDWQWKKHCEQERHSLWTQILNERRICN